MPRKIGLHSEAEIRRFVRERVNLLLEARKATRLDLARILEPGTNDKTTVMRILQEKKPITVELLEQLADAFEMAPEEFLGEDAGTVAAIWPRDIKRRMQVLMRRAMTEYERDLAEIRGQIGKKFAANLQQRARSMANDLEDFAEQIGRLRADFDLGDMPTPASYLSRRLPDEMRIESEEDEGNDGPKG